uniref:Nucleocapsid protein n=1 Tax=Dipteran orthomyxo-related virus OKIAV193 TaxID=2746274 RepID=A0A7D7J3W3_9ORTO|nr:nucleocapsid protein [Dipteran orthomyxo-related virus OKIAV193]
MPIEPMDLTEYAGIQAAKRPKIMFDEDVKQKALSAILHCHEWAAIHFKSNYLQVDDMATISSFIYTAHTRLKQASSGAGTIITKTDATGVVHSLLGIDLTPKEFAETIKGIMKAYGFTYGSTDKERSATGTLNSILSLIVAYKLRLSEVRMGNSSIPKGKVGANQKSITIGSYGLNSSHNILLAGSSFSPNIQSSMKSNLGPMTIVINLCDQTDRKYQDAWKKVFVDTFHLLPFALELADTLAGSQFQHIGIIKSLGDLCLFGINRSSNKAYIPVSLLMAGARLDTTYTSFIEGGAAITGTHNAIAPQIKNLDFSGKGLYYLWNSVASERIQFTMYKGRGMTVATAQELMFHSVFGTQREDLGLLKWMTNHNFQTRRAMNTQLQERKTGGQIDFSLLTFKFICKLASAAQTSYLTGGQGQIARVPVFSGKVKQKIDTDGELFKVLKRKNEMYYHRTAQNDVARFTSRLEQVKQIIENKILEDQKIHFGTSEFYAVNVSDLSIYGPKVDCTFEMVGDYFYKQEA